MSEIKHRVTISTIYLSGCEVSRDCYVSQRSCRGCYIWTANLNIVSNCRNFI